MNSIQKYKNKIASELISAYNKGIMSISIDKIDKKYDDRTEFDLYETVNDAANELVKDGYIALQMESKSRSRIKRIKIVEEMVELLAKKYNLVTRSTVDEMIKIELDKYKESPFVEVRDFVNAQLVAIESRKQVKFVHNDDISVLKDALVASEAVLSQTDDVPLRVLSGNLFKDTKRLEKVVDQVMQIVNTDGDDRKDFLEKHHIFGDSTYVRLKGNGVIYFEDGGFIRLNRNDSIQFSSGFVNRIKYVDTCEILTVENLTSFNRHIPDVNNGIIIYLGGFSNNVNVEFIKKCDAPVKHFGDLDANGFKILHNLQERIARHVTTWHMDISTVDANLKNGKPMSNFNRIQLSNMIQDDRYDLNEKEVFQLLLRNNITIEQEVIDVSDLEDRQQGISKRL